MNETLPAQLPEPDRISDLLRRLMDVPPEDESISVGRILHSFGVRGFAFLLMTLAILNTVIFMVPFLSFFLGLPMVLLSAQMVIGLHSPIFPDVVRRRKISRKALVDGLALSVRWIEKAEQYIKPRATFLLAPPMMKLHALMAMLLAMMVTLPIPVVNVPPSIALIFLSIGILQRDGLFVIAGYIGGIWCLWMFRSISHVLHTIL